MRDEQLLRYSRHILLDDIGIEGQERLLASHALIVGAGGLGCPVAMYLASAGVGRISLVDHDSVDLTNLQRQIGHSTERIGMNKAQSLAQTLAHINPEVQVQTLAQRADAALLRQWLVGTDVVLDCSDNFATRQAINQVCFELGVPLVSGAATRTHGQLAVFDPRQAASPCYACVFPPDSAVTDAQCATLGVLAPLVGWVGSAQAAQALLLLAQGQSSLTGQLCLFDAANLGLDRVKLPRNKACPVCSVRRFA